MDTWRKTETKKMKLGVGMQWYAGIIILFFISRYPPLYFPRFNLESERLNLTPKLKVGIATLRMSLMRIKDYETTGTKYQNSHE